VAKTVDHELSGNVIDLCPVGALTAKPSRFHARAWEVRQTASIAPHDAVGSNISIHNLRERLTRVVPRDNEAINEVWISDRDRFSYEGVMHEDRIAAPMIKKGDEWVVTDWQTAIDTAIEGIKSVVDAKGGDALGAWVSPQATLEEMFLIQGIVRHLGSHNIDHRLLQTDFRTQGSEPALPGLGMAIADIEQLDALLIVGCNIRKEQPIIAHRIRKAANNDTGNGAKVSTIGSRDFDLRFDCLENIVTHPASLVNELAGIAVALNADIPASIKTIVDKATAGAQHKAIAESLKSAKSGLIMLGQISQMHPDYSILELLAQAIAQAAGITCSSLPASANTVGAWQAGIVPHRLPGGVKNGQPGRNIAEMIASPLSALILHQVEPQEDCADPRAALNAARAADFIVATTTFVNDEIRDYANVILPVAPYTETDGSFVNMEGLAQSFNAAVKTYAESSPAWKVYRVLGEQLGIENYQYETANEVMADILQCGKADTAADSIAGDLELRLKGDGLTRCGEQSIYAVDALVRRAGALQDTADGKARRMVVINQNTAKQTNIGESDTVRVSQGDASSVLDLVIDDMVADGSIWLPLIPELGGLNQPVTLKAAG